MTQFTSISETDLTERRQQLRRQRRLRFTQAIWRVSAVCGMTAGLLWTTTLPGWVLRQPNQVQVDGNQLLSDAAIQGLLPITYPQTLLQLRPQIIAAHLETQALIDQAVVTRHLLPPGLQVEVRERQPVAIAILGSASQPLPSNPDPDPKVGFLDAKGGWMPSTAFESLSYPPDLVTLRLRGIESVYLTDWPKLYQQLQHSPVKILELDWRDPDNLILLTELGSVYVGPYGPRFDQQLTTLARMRQLPQQIDHDSLDYIDLRRLDAPVVQMLPAQTAAES